MIIDMTQGENNEEELLRRVQEGDRAATQALYRRHVGYLAAVCSRYIAGEDDVKDVLQDCFLKIFAAIGSFTYRGRGSLRGWMARIALNETLKFLSRNSRIDFTELNEEEVHVADEEPCAEGIAPQVIHELIRELPDGYRTIFNLYVVEEKSHKEIAGLLHIKESTSASQLHRAKALLAEKIRKCRTYSSISV